MVVVSENTSVGDTQVYLACGQNCRSKTTDTLDFTPVPGGIRVVNQVRLSSTNGPVLAPTGFCLDLGVKFGE